MKNTFFKTCTAAVLIVATLANCKTRTKSVYLIGTPISGFEPVYNTEPDLSFGSYNSNNLYLFTKTQLNAARKYFRDNFFYKVRGGALNSPDQQVTVGQLKTMYAALTYNPSTEYAALRIHHGMTDNNVLLVFEPVKLVPFNGDSCNIVGSLNKNFAEIAGTWVMFNDSTRNALVDTFIKNIRIQHMAPGLSKIDTFLDSQPHILNNDTKNNILPFQEILQMYNDNLDGSGSADDDIISFAIVANAYLNHSANMKMHTVAHYGIGDPQTITNFKDLGADFAQMCPPSCSKLKVNLTEAEKAANFNNNK